MKKLSFLFVAFAIVGFISLSACKSSTQPAEDTMEETVETVEQVADSGAVAMDTVATEVVE